MPHATTLWMAAAALWVLDASINISMEPFRAFVGDMLPPEQRTRGYAFQTIFIGAGAVAAACSPALLTDWLGVSNQAGAGMIPDSVRWAFYGGAAMLLLTVGWTVVSTREYNPRQMQAFEAETPAPAETDAANRPLFGMGQAIAWLSIGGAIVALVRAFSLDKPLYILGFGLMAFGTLQIVARWGGTGGRSVLTDILSDLHAMPTVMRRLAVVHFLSWFGLFVFWIYATPIVTRYGFGAADPGAAAYNEGANWVGILFGAYNAFAALYAFGITAAARRIGHARLHAINLLAGAAGLASFAVVRDPQWMLLLMLGVGMAWASILTIPYAILSSHLPPAKLGVYMGLFNIFIVLPQLVVSTLLGTLGRTFYPHDPIYSFVIAAGVMAAGAAATRLLPAD